MRTQPSLSIEGLILRPFVDEDAQRVQLLAGDQRIADTTATIPHPYPDGLAQQWIAENREKWACTETASFAITLAPIPELVTLPVAVMVVGTALPQSRQCRPARKAGLQKDRTLHRGGS